MTLGTIFWLLMIITAVFWGWGSPWTDRRGFGMGLLVYVLFFLLGWHAFGFVVRA